MPGRHHHKTKRNEHASEPNTERDNQEKPETHPL